MFEPADLFSTRLRLVLRSELYDRPNSVSSWKNKQIEKFCG